jgi:predicted nucleotidyltransferase
MTPGVEVGAVGMMRAIAAQNTFHGDLSRYINGCAFSRFSVAISLLSSKQPYKLYSRQLIRKYLSCQEMIPVCTTETKKVNVDLYRGDNVYVLRMMDYLRSKLKDDLLGAYVHGSLAVGEDIPYSDFDALVIIKSEVFSSAERLEHMAYALNDARKIMHEFDPLQHHGWFVLIEDDLTFYCDTYFPTELFVYAKSLLADSGNSLIVSLRPCQSEMSQAFDKLADSIAGKLMSGQYPDNIFRLKCLTSEFMLLPALYLQKKNGRTVFKKYSFSQAGGDFNTEDWQIMEEISRLRDEWRYDISPFQRRILSRADGFRDYFAWRLGPPIPDAIRGKLTSGFYSKMLKLVELMRSRVL